MGLGFQVSDTHYDFEGLTYTSLALSWTPHLSFKDCNQLGKECQTSVGILMDYMETLGRQFNFSVVSVQEQSESWGVNPLSGPYNFSGTWGGVMGAIMFGEHPISLSPWVYNAERHPLMDFVTVYPERKLLALTPKLPEVDIHLVLRPLTMKAWQCLLALVIGTLTFFFLFEFLIPYFDSTAGFQIIQLSLFSFFVIISAFYVGAMTMFFANELSLPFDTISEAIHAYPHWKLIYRKGMRTL